MNYAIMPYRSNPALTAQAVADVLQQTIETRLLAIANGCDNFALGREGEILQWCYVPQLSLAAVWNRALEFCWAAGADHALVVNNDVRLPNRLYEHLVKVQRDTGALFVSAVNVGDQYPSAIEKPFIYNTDFTSARGGPDFSCFLITRTCHVRFPFDEHFFPAYCEDLDYHRRLMLAGEGERIFSVCIPYLHLASGTLNALELPQREKLQAQIEQGSRRYYVQKWGGPVNAERFSREFDPTSDQDGVTTPDLQRIVEQQWRDLRT